MEIKPFFSGRMAYDITADNGEKYVFVPKEFAEKGFVLDGKQWYEPEFLKEGAFDKASTFTLPDDSAISKQAKDLYEDPTQGYIWKAEDFKPINSDNFTFQSYKITDKYPAIEGLSRVKNQYNDQLVYTVPTKEGWDQTYIWGEDKENGTHFRSTKVEQGRSLLGKVFGGVGDTLADAFNSGLDAINSLGPIPNLALAAISPTTAATIAAANAGQAAATGDFGKAALSGAAAYGLSQAGEGLLSSSPSATQAPVVDAGGAVETLSGTPSAASGTTGGLLSNTQLDADFIAADAAQLAKQGLSTNQIASTLEASGVDSFIAADAAQLATQGLGANQIASNITQGLPTATGDTGASGLFTGAGTAGTAGTAGIAGATGATLGDLGTAALIKGGLGLAGGLLQGETTKDAASTDLASRTALADKAAEMGKFTPVGITTTFGTSNFVTDPTTGVITPSYTLSPTAAGYQTSLSALGNTALSSASNIMNLGNQYINESPEAVRNRYMSTQQSLLAPGQEQQLAGIRTNLANTGRGGLSLGATSDGMLATNPELAAYYNSLAMTNRGIAADAETNYQNQVKFGTGLLGGATTPFTNIFNAATSVETAAQKPLELSTNFANTAASRGAANATNYVNTISPGLTSTYNANNYNPWATALSGMSDSDLAVWGLKKLIT